MVGIINPIPWRIVNTGTAPNTTYTLQDNAYDYALNGMPFLSATSSLHSTIGQARHYTEQMAEIRKQQFDSFAEPGEQSLYGWWLRSQSTFNGGAGVLYQDPDNDNQFNYRFSDSLGIDPWTSGELSLLRSTQQDVLGGVPAAGTPTHVRGYVTAAGGNRYWISAGENFYSINPNTAFSTIVSGTGVIIRAITSTGYTYFLAKDDGIWKGTDTGAATQIYTAALTSWAIEYLKGRLVAASGANVYQLVVSPAGAPAALPTPIYVQQDPNWQWRSITDGPTAIYIAGDSGTTSEIHKFTPTLDSGGVPVLTWTGVTASMPHGEIINDIYSYIGSFVGIATSKGFRVGEIDSNGDIAYGPLLFTPSGGCKGITGFDRFMWTGSTNAHDGNSGLYRVDLGNQIQEQTTKAVRYAYSRDIYYANSGTITSVTMFGATDRKVFGIDSFGGISEVATTKVAAGYLTTGRVRFNTEEPKLYKFFSIRTPSPLTGNVSVSVLSNGGGETPHITYGPSVGPAQKDVTIQQPTGPQNWIQLKFTLSAGASSGSGGVMNGWQIKVLPGSIRQRIITQTFLLFDKEQDKTGQSVGYDGYARSRFESFKALARAGDSFPYQELAEDLTTQVIIDDWTFTQTAPPGPNNEVIGGYLTVVMRTVADST